MYMYGHYRDGILWNMIFCGKAKLDPVHVCFYGDGLWIQWKRNQNWILYIYCILETEYGYSGIGYMHIFHERENWILYINDIY